MIGRFLKSLMYLAVAGRLKKFTASLENPEAAQSERFRQILANASGTVFAADHSLGNIRTIRDYRNAVPIRDYSGFYPYIESMLEGEENVLVSSPVTMFAVTSGSTAQPKFIPITRSFTVEYHNSHLIWMYNMIKQRSDKVIGSIFSMVSPAEEGWTKGGIPYGSSSGKQYRDQSIPVRALHPLPYQLFLISKPQIKYYAALILALLYDLRVVNSVNPSSLVMLAAFLRENSERMFEDIVAGNLSIASELPLEVRANILVKMSRVTPKRISYLRNVIEREGWFMPKAVWPGISAINTWQGGNAPFYLGRVRELWGEAPQRCFGLRATEGMFTIPLEDNSASGVLAVNGHFMEFIEDGIEVEPSTPTLLAHELEVGKRYRLIITTSSGLYRYDLGDIVEVTGMNKNTPEVAFLHKAGGVLSITGEKVYEDQLVAVMSRICRNIADKVNGFSVTIEFTDRVRYVLLLELEEQVAAEQLEELLSAFDIELARENIEYSDKRRGGRLEQPFMLLLERGSYQRYRESLVLKGRPDGQIKPLYIINPYGEGLITDSDAEFFSSAVVIKRLEVQSEPVKI